MITYLKHDQIDRERWDKCVGNSPRVIPYGFSWYLDIMAPGWEALVDDDYNAVFPVPGFKKYGINYVATPIFLQQLGVFSPDKNLSDSITQFVENMPEFYRLIDLCVGQEIRHTDFEVTARVNFVLDLSPAYEKLYENFSRNCKRNIETSLEKRQDLSMDIKPSEVTGLFRKNKGKELREIKQRDYNRLENLMDYCFNSNRGRIVGVRNDNGKLIYGLFYIFLNGNKTMIFLANTPESHERRTGYYVYNELIKESAGTGAQFDFAGSSIPSIARFMESFGSKSFHYYRIYRNRLPWPLRYFK